MVKIRDIGAEVGMQPFEQEEISFMSKSITPEQLAKAGTEHSHQCALFCWAAIIPELRTMFAIPNGEQRSAVTGARLKAAGVKAGVPDIFLPVARNGKHGLWIELKTIKGVVSEKQSEWLEQLAQQGYATRVCFGWEMARDCLLEYLERKQS